jgi:predicted phosphodiesterase
LRWAATGALVLVVGLVGAGFALAVAGRQTVTLGPFTVQLSAAFGRGVTDIQLPPVGRITADTHRAPLHLTATLEDVGVPALTDTIRQEGLDAIAPQVQRDARQRVAPFALRVFFIGVGGGLALALIVFRLRWRFVLASTLVAAVAVGGSELAAASTYRPGAFASPTFSGSLSIAHELIGPAREATNRIDDFRDQLTRIVAGAASVYASIQASPVGTPGEITVLHISDIHLSPLGMEFAQELAKSFDVDMVIDTGDITSFGTPAEDAILSFIPGFDRPYVFVRGNHDSVALQEEMAKIPNVTVLDGTDATVHGLTIYGLGDPVFTPNKLAAGDDAQIAAAVHSVGPRILRDLSALPGPPAVVAVHDDRMADAVAGRVPLVISGHFHVPSARVADGTLYLRIGSTGGAGANVYTEQGGVPLSAEILYFVPGDPARLVAYDLIQQSPVTGSLTVQRHLVAQQFGRLIPSPPAPSPTLSPTPSAAPSG